MENNREEKFTKIEEYSFTESILDNMDKIIDRVIDLENENEKLKKKNTIISIFITLLAIGLLLVAIIGLYN